jgi:hypothetical protein
MRDDTRDPNGYPDGYNYEPAPGEWQALFDQARECGATIADAQWFANEWTSGSESY